MILLGKALLRKTLCERLAQIPPEQRAHDSLQAYHKLVSSKLWDATENLLLFAGTAQEPDTIPLALEALKSGKKLFFPRTVNTRGEMEVRQVTSLDHLKKGRWNLLEPSIENCPVADVMEVDLALIPGLAFDRSGARLGRGGGYYDRLLGQLQFRAVKIGFFFSIQEVSTVPTEPHDRKMDWVLTENELFQTKGVSN